MTERTPPKIPDAPGLVLQMRKDGWAAIWQARTDLVKRGWEPKRHNICMIADDPTAEEIDFVQIHCQRLQRQMLKFASAGYDYAYDGTLASLINCYQLDKDSPYKKLRFATRRNYESQLGLLSKERGAEWVADIKARQIKRWHEDYLPIGIYGAHNRMTMLRLVIGFGATILEDEECMRVRGLLAGLKFTNGKPRDLALTAEMAAAIIVKAHELGFPMVALAQAFQFECTLRQKDVIGEWVPPEEPGPETGITNPKTGWKWMRGLMWSEINDMVLEHETSKRNKVIVANLRFAPMVQEELKRFDIIPKQGAVIIDPETQRPYYTTKFREQWRAAATAAGVPREYWNMDTRAGAITEATDSGATLEDARHAATHSNVATTQRYSRGSAKKVENVMQLRVKSRNKT